MRWIVGWRTRPEDGLETIEGETEVTADTDDEAWEIIQQSKRIENGGRVIQVAYVEVVH